jgi:hypothetical protein
MIGLMMLLALVIYVWLARLAVKFIANRTAKYAVAALFILIPTWDIVLGRLYLNYLCSTEAGVKVYRTVKLSSEYWDTNGRAKFLKQNGDFDSTFFKGRFKESRLTVPIGPFFKIDEIRQQLVDSSNQKVLGEVVSFMYWGGWVSRNSGLHNSATDCGEFHGNKFWFEFYSRFFQRSETP